MKQQEGLRMEVDKDSSRMEYVRPSSGSYFIFITALFFLLATPALTHAAQLNASGILGQGSYTTRQLSWPSGSINAEGFGSTGGTGLYGNGWTSTALDPINHRLFVSDIGNYRILVFPLSVSNNITTTTASSVLGACNFTSQGNQTTSSSTFGGEGQVTNIAYDAVNDRLFVSDGANNRVLEFNVAPGFANCEGAGFVLGQPNFTSSTFVTTQSSLLGIDDIAYDASSSRLFVSDSENNRVMAFSVPANATSGINGEPALFELGQPAGPSEFTSTDSGTTQSEFSGSGLTGEAYDPVNSRLFIDDYYYNRVMVFSVPAAAPTSSLDGEPALFELGQPAGASEFTSSIASTTQSGLNGPDDDTYDPVGNRLFVGDFNNNRIMVFSVPATTPTSSLDGENAMANIGQSSWTSHATGVTQNTDNAFDPNDSYNEASNTIYLEDLNNFRVLEVSMIHITNTSMPSGTVNSSYSQTITTTSTQGTSQTFSVFSGSLPQGLSLNSSTGVISGTPTVATTTTATIQANDNFSDGSAFFDQETYTFQMNAASPPSITSFSASSSLVAPAGTSTLSWNITNASSVAITPGSFSTSTLIGSTTVNPTSTTIYTITATNANGTSTATTTVNVATAPTAPGSFSVGSPTTSTLSLSWTSSTPNNGATISFYAIYRGNASTTISTFIATTTNASYVNTGLATSTTYWYDVTAQDSVGNVSASSTNASGTTLSGILPSITSFSASSSLVAPAGTSTLSWNITNASSVAITPGSFSTSTLIGSTTVNPTSTTIYTITATNANGTSTATTTVTIVAPPVISAISSGAPLTNSATITWTTNIAADSSVEYGTTISYGSTGPYNATLVTSHSVTLSGLSPGSLYHFAVISAVTGASTTSGDNTFTTGAQSSGGSEPGAVVSVAAGYGSPFLVTPPPPTTSSLQSELTLLLQELATLRAQANGSTPFTFTRNLSLNDTGTDVNALQQFLVSQTAGPAAQKLKAHGTTDFFGLLTYHALVEFQGYAGIAPASGFFGPITRAWMNAHE